MASTSATPARSWVEQWLSPPRLGKYRIAAADDADRAFALYEWNSQLSATLMASRLFPPLFRTNHGRRVDVNERRRRQLEAACTKVGRSAPPGKVVAELSFGFWRFLSSAAHEKSIWVPYLHHAFPAGTDRKDDVDDRITRLHGLRNRVAHHEPLLGQRVRDDYAALISLATLILPPLAQHIAATSAVVRILSRKP